MKYFCCLLLIHIPLAAYFSLDSVKQKNLSIFPQRVDPKACVTFLEDKKNKCLYLVKQKDKKGSAFTRGRQFKVVRELFGARVASLLGIRAHEVCLIPAGVSFLGKPYPESLATLHTVVPGVNLNESPYKDVSLKQWSPGKGSSKKGVGLNRRVISGMARHPDFPGIAAYDTFTADNDRHKKNVYWLKNNNCCYLIDMDCALSYNLAQLACEQLQEIQYQGISTLKFSEIIALKQYRDALQHYVQQCPLSVLLEIFDDVCRQCDFTKEKGVFTDNAIYVKCHRKILVENYQSVLDLIALLDMICSERVVQLAQSLKNSGRGSYYPTVLKYKFAQLMLQRNGKGLIK